MKSVPSPRGDNVYPHPTVYRIFYDPTSDDPMRVALSWAKRGFRVLPLVAGTKRPLSAARPRRTRARPSSTWGGVGRGSLECQVSATFGRRWHRTGEDGRFNGVDLTPCSALVCPPLSPLVFIRGFVPGDFVVLEVGGSIPPPHSPHP